MMNIVCASCKQRSQVTEAEYEACGHNWTCICKKPIPEGMQIRQCGLNLHSPTYQPKGTFIYSCSACQAEIDASRSIKVIYPNGDPYAESEARRKENFIPLPPVKSFNEIQIELLQEISKKLDRLLPEPIPMELSDK